MSLEDKVRVGFIGAGSICRTRHLPNLTELDDVDVLVVANRTMDSARRVAREFDIPEATDDWKSLIERDDLDAVFIGTWPYMHREMSVAVLESGKHCFCQARMARDLEEAKAMLRCAQQHPELVNMICPPPTRMPFEPFIRKTLQDGRLGRITAVSLTSASSGNLDRQSLTWREDINLSGKQILAMGIFAETLNAWVGPYESLNERTSTPIPTKSVDGKTVDVHIPQVVTISGRLADGVIVNEIHSGVVTDQATQGNCLTIWGLEGTLRYTFGSTIEIAEPGGPLEPVDVPDTLQRPWRVERDFIAAIAAARRGESWTVSPDFAEGVDYMRKVEAVHEAAASGRAVKPAEL